MMASVTESRLFGMLPLHRPKPRDGGISFSKGVDVLNARVWKYMCRVSCTQPVQLWHRSPIIACAMICWWVKFLRRTFAMQTSTIWRWVGSESFASVRFRNEWPETRTTTARPPDGYQENAKSWAIPGITSMTRFSLQCLYTVLQCKQRVFFIVIFSRALADISCSRRDAGWPETYFSFCKKWHCSV
jgi:hypothetical protein